MNNKTYDCGNDDLPKQLSVVSENTLYIYIRGTQVITTAKQQCHVGIVCIRYIWITFNTTTWLHSIHEKYLYIVAVSIYTCMQSLFNAQLVIRKINAGAAELSKLWGYN